MKLYINTKELEFDGIVYEVILKASETKFNGYDILIDVKKDDPFMRTRKITYVEDNHGEDTEEIDNVAYLCREQDSWYNFPLYQIVDMKIVSFDYTQYEYFSNTKRRMRLGKRISGEYNQYTEAKILRKTLKYIMDTLVIEYPSDFQKYNNKVEQLIAKNPK